MQVTAANPQFISREDVSADALAREKAIQRERALKEGKPEKMVDKIAEGRLAKFFEEVCLLEQPFIKDNAMTVGELIRSKADGLGRGESGAFCSLQSWRGGGHIGSGSIPASSNPIS